MTTRLELLGKLVSKGIVVSNPIFENEDLAVIDGVIEDILDKYCDEYCDGTETCNCPKCVENPEDVEVVEDMDLIGRTEGDTEVVHMLYPGAEHYPLIMDWANRIKDEFDGVDLQYFEDQDVFIFFSGDEDKALKIVEKIIDEIESV